MQVRSNLLWTTGTQKQRCGVELGIVDQAQLELCFLFQYFSTLFSHRECGVGCLYFSKTRILIYEYETRLKYGEIKKQTEVFAQKTHNFPQIGEP